MKSFNEEYCRAKFEELLRTSALVSSVIWEDGDEPPDYYLRLDDVTYAVEVTILMEQQTVGSKSIPQATVKSVFWNFVDDVEAIAKENNLLHGTYTVSFRSPILNFNAVRNQIQSALLRYVTQTRDLEKASETIAFQRGREVCAIQKWHNSSDKIEPTLTNLKWEGEALIEICNLLEDRLVTKSRKLQNITYPKIILLYDSYHFADTKMFQQCISTSPSVSMFHTIVLIRSDTGASVLFSSNRNWQ